MKSIKMIPSRLLIRNLFFTSLNKCKKSKLYQSHKIYVAGSYNKLLNNKLKGEINYSIIKKHGNFGLGTFDFLNGEMIALDSKFYRANKHGLLHHVSISEHAPLAIVCNFNQQQARKVNIQQISMENLQKYLLEIKGSYSGNSGAMAIRIDMIANSINYRSVENTNPYTTFNAILNNQQLLYSKQQSGTLVGFYFSKELETLTSSGFHFHFIDNSRLKGGHVHDCHLREATVYTQHYSASEVQAIERCPSHIMMPGKSR